MIEQLTANLRNLSGKLTITGVSGELGALQAIAVELAQREDMTVHGDIIVLPPDPGPPPPPEGGGDPPPEPIQHGNGKP